MFRVLLIVLAFSFQAIAGENSVSLCAPQDYDGIMKSSAKFINADSVECDDIEKTFADPNKLYSLYSPKSVGVSKVLLVSCGANEYWVSRIYVPGNTGMVEYVGILNLKDIVVIPH